MKPEVEQHAREGGGRLEAILRPHPSLEDPGDVRSARLLALMALILAVLVLLTALLQAALIEGFQRTLTVMLAVLPINFLVYGLARSRLWRAGALIFALLPVGACLAVGAFNPTDPAWFAFLFMGPMVGAILLPTRQVIGVLLVGLLGIVALGLLHPAYASPDRWVPYAVFQGIAGALLVIWKRHAVRVETLRREAVQEQERRLSQVQRLETVGQMAAGVAHDLNTLLAVISAASELADQQPEDAREHHRTTLEAVDRGAEIVRGLLAFARARHADPAPLDLRREMESCATLVRQVAGRRCPVSIEVGEDLPIVRIDRARFEQVLFNLVTNAAQAMPDGGAIQVSVQRRVGAPDSEAGAPGMDASRVFALIRVRDGGQGMEPETRDRIFEPFYSTRSEGTGLGLATVHGIVKEAGGQIRVESEPGKGSTFEVWLPQDGDGEPV